MEDYGYYIIISIGLVAFICFPIAIICYDLCSKKNNNNIEIERRPLLTKV